MMSCQVLCYQPLITRVHYNPKNTLRVAFKIQFFARFSLVSHSIHPRSRRGDEPIRQGEGRWNRPPKTALDRSYLTENFQFPFKPCRRQAKQVLESMPPQYSNIGNDRLEMMPILEIIQALQTSRYNRSLKITSSNSSKCNIFGNISLVLLSIRPRSRRGAERIRPGGGRWSRLPETALEQGYLTDNSSLNNCI